MALHTRFGKGGLLSANRLAKPTLYQYPLCFHVVLTALRSTGFKKSSHSLLLRAKSKKLTEKCAVLESRLRLCFAYVGVGYHMLSSALLVTNLIWTVNTIE